MLSKKEFLPGKSPIIKNFPLSLPSIGNIKIGKKGELRKTKDGKKEYRTPKKLKHFLITKLDRDSTGNFIKDEAIHKLIGDEPLIVPIYLLHNSIELNFQSRYVYFKGRTVICNGDGKNAILKNQDGSETQIECPCKKLGSENEKERCKCSGILSAIIRGVDIVGGVWKYRTSGYNSTKGIQSTLLFFHNATGGQLAGIPFQLAIRPMNTIVKKTGESQLIYVVGLEYVGSIEKLKENALKQIEQNASYKHQIEEIEQKALKGITAEILPEEYDDVVDEFYPEQAIIGEDGEEIKVNTETGEIKEGCDSGPKTEPEKEKKAPKLKPSSEKKTDKPKTELKVQPEPNSKSEAKEPVEDKEKHTTHGVTLIEDEETHEPTDEQIYEANNEAIEDTGQDDLF